MRSGLCLILTVIVVGAPAHADVADDLAEARRFWLKGNYEEALERYAQIEKQPGADKAAVTHGRARCLVATGRDDEALKVLAAGPADQPDLLALAADIHLDAGRYDEARKAAERALAKDGKNLPARWAKAKLLSATGQFEKANLEFEWFINAYNESQFKDADKILLVARAAAEYARWNKLPDEFDFILNELIPDALSAEADYWPAHAFAGGLLVEKYNKAEGVPELKKALAINPNAVEAVVALGVSAAQDYDFAEGKVHAEHALSINPRSADALRLTADLFLLDGQTDAARAPLEKALEIHPTAEETLGRLAACHELRGRRPEAEKIEREVRARNPRPGVFYYAYAEPLDRRRQFDRAEALFKESIAAAPHLAAPRSGLGLLYMKIGKEDEARAVLAEARALDPFHVRVTNMTKVLEHLKKYEVVRTSHYEVWIEPTKDKMLGQYMAEYLEMTHDALCKRFGYEPPERSKIEILTDHAWFSARVVGLPSIGTVGACTGNLVAMASPRSLRQPYNWARVLTHEVTHVITLQQTKFNIPHWYTEALAVMSEGYPRSETWNQLLRERVPKGDLFNLDNLNHAFVRPKTPLDWQMAYCLSQLYAEYMIERAGEKSLAGMLAAYRDGLETPAAIEKVFGVKQAEFEKGYREFLDRLVKGLVGKSARPARSFAEAERALAAKPDDPELLGEVALHNLRRKNNLRARELADKAIEKDKNAPIARYVLARMEFSIGKTKEALALLEPAFDKDDPREEVVDLLAAIRLREKDYDKAASLYEVARKGDPQNPKWIEGLARVAILAKDDAKLPAILVELAKADADNLSARKKLAELALARKDWAEAERWARQTLYIDVADADAHRALGRAAMETKRFPIAAREFQAAIDLKTKDRQAPLDLADALLKSGEKRKAKERLEKIVAGEPDNRRAKQLLEEASRP